MIVQKRTTHILESVLVTNNFIFYRCYLLKLVHIIIYSTFVMQNCCFFFFTNVPKEQNCKQKQIWKSPQTTFCFYKNWKPNVHKRRNWQPSRLKKTEKTKPYRLGFQIPWKTIFRFYAQRSWETIWNNFLVAWKFIVTHLLNDFNFLKSYVFSWH